MSRRSPARFPFLSYEPLRVRLPCPSPSRSRRHPRSTMSNNILRDREGQREKNALASSFQTVCISVSVLSYITETAIVSPTKRKRVELDADLSDVDLPDDEDDDEDDYKAPSKFKPPATARGRGRGSGRGRGRGAGTTPSAPKRPRANKTTTLADTPRARKAGTTLKSTRSVGEARISDDNALFSPSLSLYSRTYLC